MKVREFWFDLETTSEGEPVVNCIFFEKPEYEVDHHVIEKSAYDKAVKALKKIAADFGSGYDDENTFLAHECLKELGESV